MISNKKEVVKEFLNGALPHNVEAHDISYDLKWIYTDEASDKFYLRLDMAGQWLVESYSQYDTAVLMSAGVLEWMLMGSKMIKGGK